MSDMAKFKVYTHIGLFGASGFDFEWPARHSQLGADSGAANRRCFVARLISSLQR
jgi:hypothetical protein